MKKALSILTLLLLMAATMQAQNQKKPDWQRWHYLSEEEMFDKSRGTTFVETDPPTGILAAKACVGIKVLATVVCLKACSFGEGLETH